jgi:hypothetical protein
MHARYQFLVIPVQSVQFLMALPLRSAVNEAASVFLVLCTVADTLETTAHLFERSQHVHVVFGVSRGVALVALGSVLAMQFAAQLTLIFNRFFTAVGSLLPSATLVAVVWADAFVLGELADAVTLTRCTAVSAGAATIALFRYDRNARASVDQVVPENQTLLAVGLAVKEQCSRLRLGIILTPISLVLFAYAAMAHSFWASRSSAAREYHWSRFRACMALSASCLLVAAQDVASFVFFRDRMEQWMENTEGEGGVHLRGVRGVRSIARFLQSRNASVLGGAARAGAKKKLY